MAGCIGKRHFWGKKLKVRGLYGIFILVVVGIDENLEE
jgi:hypothetical protein